MMKKTALLLILFQTAFGHLKAQDTLWIRYDNRFQKNAVINIADVDSIEVRNNQLRLYHGAEVKNQSMPVDKADAMFTDPGRYLLKPNTYAGTDYTNDKATTGYNFAHSLESEHFAVFWDVRFGDNPARISIGSYTCNANTVLEVAEKCWDVYVGKLGFLKEGKSTTDDYKIQLYIPYQTEWRADASGTDGASGGKTGLGHFNPWAATARGGHTIAHEVGHTFQYLVSADLGMNHGFNYGYGNDASGGNGWWESCADWQAYKIFPERQFTDGEYFEQYLPLCHLNLMHEDMRYENCFIQDYWCMKHGQDFIGRLWRESNKPEDPVQAYQRICGINYNEFCMEQMEGVMRMATWDIDGVRQAAANRIGQFKNYLKLADQATGTYQIDVDHCPQNFGFNICNMRAVAPGTTVKAHFKGIAGADGYRKVQTAKAGWRYAFVARMSNGERLYGTVESDAEGTAQLTIPEDKGNCLNLFFVVMGAPKSYWRHPWDDNATNDEQWPYQVSFEGTAPRF